MEKSDIVTFLEQKRRGIYNVLVSEYWDSILASTPVNLALTLITGDLEKATGQKVTLKYVSLAQAVSKAKTKRPVRVLHSNESEKVQQKAKTKFRDAHEIEKEKHIGPGKFKIEERQEDGAGEKRNP